MAGSERKQLKTKKMRLEVKIERKNKDDNNSKI